MAPNSQEIYMAQLRNVFLMALVGLALFLPVSVRADDRFIIAGAELTTPEGWALQEQGELSILLHESGGARLEVASLQRIPTADPKAIADVLRARKDTTEVVVT